MLKLRKHGLRVAFTLLPLLLAIVHVLGIWPLETLHRLDGMIYDARLRATLAKGHDQRIVIVDIDEKSLAEVGRWPWPRHQVAALVDRLFDGHGIAALGFDMVFAEPDTSSGWDELQELTRGPLAGQPGLAQRVKDLQPTLDYDSRLAKALTARPVVLGYYFSSDQQGRSSGALPSPVMAGESCDNGAEAAMWTGYGANLPLLARAAPRAGFFNAVPSVDGVVRTLPLIAAYQGACYESLSLALFRLLSGSPQVIAKQSIASRSLTHLRLQHPGRSLTWPLDEQLGMLVPFKGPGGPQGGTFTYVSAADVLAQRVAGGQLHNKVVLVGTTAPGLLDLRVTPLGTAYPGVEVHANLLASLMDGRQLVRPDYAPGYELVVLLTAGLLLALLLPVLPAGRALMLSGAVVAVVVGFNTWLYVAYGLVLPLASAFVVTVLAASLNMGYGYLVESRSKRKLAQLFRADVPPELVHEMLKEPERYSMTADTRELTVIFCDMRNFTALAESMEPNRLQALLHQVFSRLSTCIRQQRGTIDKYMGDCVMAFWGAPVSTPDHAAQAVQAALDMVASLVRLNEAHAKQDLPTMGLGIGINTGLMCVGDMGSDERRSYTVVGDAVNLGARLERLTSLYGVDIIASESTRAQAPQFVWQELDRVQVKGRADPVTLYTPLGTFEAVGAAHQDELQRWQSTLQAWRSHDWARCEQLLAYLLEAYPHKGLYRLYAERMNSLRQQPGM